MTERFLPGATIGVMGGGQLGRMFAIAARRMGYRIHVFVPEKDSPTGQFADAETIAAYDDENALDEFVKEIDVLTFEFENIPAATVDRCAQHVVVRPSSRVLHICQHRLREKTFLRDNGFPVAPFREIETREEFDNALDEIGRPAILKTAAWGYDGKGQQFIGVETSVDDAWARRPGDQLVLERAIDFECEISAIVARSPSGEMCTLPVGENIHRNHILDFTIVPARVDARTQAQANELARTIAEKIELVGLLAVEMFVKRSGELLINELAPRPHNSGHWSIEGCATSQFEQHVRAACGLPLGATDLLRPTAMANLLGEVWASGEPDWSRALQTANVHLHLYGKREPRPRRKMGHLTATAPGVEQAFAAVREARNALGAAV